MEDDPSLNPGHTEGPGEPALADGWGHARKWRGYVTRWECAQCNTWWDNNPGRCDCEGEPPLIRRRYFAEDAFSARPAVRAAIHEYAVNGDMAAAIRAAMEAIVSDS